VADKAAERTQRYLGRLEHVLVEGRNPKDASQVMGRTRGNRLAFFPGDVEALCGRIVPIRVTEARAFSLSSTFALLPFQSLQCRGVDVCPVVSQAPDSSPSCPRVCQA